MKSCNHCHMPRGNGHAVRLPGGRVFIACTPCHLRLVRSFPTYPELVEAILAAHAYLRKPVTP